MSAKKKFEHMQDVTDTKGACSNEYSLSPSALLVYRGLVGDAGWHLVPQISKETDRHFCLHTEAALFSLSSEIFTLELRRVAVADFLLRNFCSSLLFLSSSGHSVRIIPPHSDQYIIERSHLTVSADDGTVSIEFNIQKQSADDDEIFFEKTLPLLVSAWATRCTENNSQLVAHWQCLEDQCALREMISNLGVSFVADGSILPRAGAAVITRCRTPSRNLFYLKFCIQL